MNNPYPSRSQLRVESSIDRLLAEQDTATRAFQQIVTDFTTAFHRLHFPLASPAQGYDLDDVSSTLADWLLPYDQRYLEQQAADIASCEQQVFAMTAENA